MQVDASTDQGLLVTMGDGESFGVPISPGMFRAVSVSAARLIPFHEPLHFRGPGVLALDGDRDHKLRDGMVARLRISRSGPRILNIKRIMQHAVEQGMIGA